jgi:hypothetical protein
MINRLLGRGKRTLWCEGYDSPVVLTPVRALVAIAYLYANPAKDNLKEARQNLCFLARERARERERKRTRNKKLKFFGYVHVYEHEHVHVVISKVRLWGRFCLASLSCLS